MSQSWFVFYGEKRLGLVTNRLRDDLIDEMWDEWPVLSFCQKSSSSVNKDMLCFFSCKLQIIPTLGNSCILSISLTGSTSPGLMGRCQRWVLVCWSIKGKSSISSVWAGETLVTAVWREIRQEWFCVKLLNQYVLWLARTQTALLMHFLLVIAAEICVGHLYFKVGHILFWLINPTPGLRWML